MKPDSLIFFICLLCGFTESTDLVISYRGDLKILKNVEVAEKSNISIEDIKLENRFGFPMALSYAEYGRKLFLSDYDNDEIDIYSISLDDNNKIMPIIDNIGTSQIESITYDPLLERLYWSDVFRYGIYTNITTRRSMPNILYESSSMQPRSITVDSCKQILYWSDRDEGNPKIVAFDLNTKTPSVLVESQRDADLFYHAVSFDVYNNLLWWFETNSDASQKSSCKIMKKTEFGISLHTTLYHCYPFAITFDENFLYWNDWGREAVMRLSKTNSSDLVELLSVPNKDKYRAFGIANINNTDNFNCDASLIIKEELKRIQYNSDYINYSQQEEQLSNSAATSNKISKISFSILPNRYTTIEDMKTIYNNFHKMQLAFLCVSFICSIIALFTIINLYMKFRNITKKLGNVSTIDVNAMPPFDVYKPKRKYKLIVPRITASPRKNTTVDIENCCQMTLCDKPCEIAMKKGSHFGTKQKKPEDKLQLLNDFMA